MTQWEYKAIGGTPEMPSPSIEDMDALGLEGWELVQFVGGVALFKRELPDYASTESEDE